MPVFLNMRHKPTHYTISGKTDGFGAQYQAIMSGIAYCAAKGLLYVHTPFTRMEHTTDVAALNTFIGITTPQQSSTQSLIIRKPFAAEVHNSVRPSRFYTPSVRQILKDYYYSTPKPAITEIDIAIHIRRGDVGPHLASRYTDNHLYRRIINGLQRAYPGRSITVFSEGCLEDFHDLGINPAQLRLNTDIQTTFHSLVTAKVLITAKSSFSYAAAILNDNIVYYMDFWHKALDTWAPVDSLLAS
jgi:hypothetical protein